MSKYPSKACVCTLLTIWICVGVCSTIVTIVFYLQPFLKAIRYRQTTCRVESTFFTTQFVCPCEASPTGSKQHCPSYPCFLVHVSLNISHNELWVVKLFSDNEQQAAVNDASTEQQEMCTLRVCSSDPMHNRDRVDNFSRQYAAYVGQMVPCHYDPWDIRSGAVLHAALPGWKVFHAVFWPFAGVALGVLACVAFCRRCHRDAVNASDATTAESEDCKPPSELHAETDDVSSYVVAAKALLQAQKRRRKHNRSIRSLWMVYQNT